jgi:hypothetical protein
LALRYHRAVKSLRRLRFPCRLYLIGAAVLVAAATAQVKSVAGQPFRNDSIGLDYAIPSFLVPAPENELPRDPTGRELVILALWDSPRRTPTPRVVFLYDTKARPSTLTLDQIGEDYLRSLKPGEGFKMEQPRKVSVAGNPMWRMDFWRPDDSGQSFNSSFAIPLKDRRVLFIQVNASSQRQLDLLVDSLQGLKFDRK